MINYTVPTRVRHLCSRKIFSFFNQTANFLYPDCCPLCHLNSDQQGFCSQCTQAILSDMLNYPHRCPQCAAALAVNQTKCTSCEQLTLGLNHVYALFDYTFPLTSLIAHYKIQGQLYLARCFALLAQQRLQIESICFPSNTPLIPIPSNTKSLNRRYFNPANEFAYQLSKQLGLPLANQVLRRYPSSIKQSKQNAAGRLRSSANLYYAAHRLPFSHALLVDDVLTSGSTLQSAFLALKSAGVGEVSAIVIARTPP